MATIQKRVSKDGSLMYRVRIRRTGTPLQTATFRRLTDAKKWAQVVEGAVLDGKRFPTAAAKRYTLADLIDRYIDDVLPHKSASSMYMQTLQLRWWKAQLGSRRLAELTPPLLATYRDKLARGTNKHSRSNATIVRYLAALSHAFSVAIREWRWLEENPVRQVTRPKEPRGRVRFLDEAEREHLLAICRTSQCPYLYIVVVLALSTGARKMELMALTWRDVDLARGVLTLHHTKNGDTRALPLTGQALRLLQAHAQGRRRDTPLVFPRPDGQAPLDIRTAWETAVRRAGLVDFRFHDLRHSAASYLAMDGASLKEIAEVLGHRSLQMSARYAHLSQPYMSTIVARMNRKIFGEAHTA